MEDICGFSVKCTHNCVSSSYRPYCSYSGFFKTREDAEKFRDKSSYYKDSNVQSEIVQISISVEKVLTFLISRMLYSFPVEHISDIGEELPADFMGD